jgi:hypothetical protein
MVDWMVRYGGIAVCEGYKTIKKLPLIKIKQTIMHREVKKTRKVTPHKKREIG